MDGSTRTETVSLPPTQRPAAWWERLDSASPKNRHRITVPTTTTTATKATITPMLTPRRPASLRWPPCQSPRPRWPRRRSGGRGGGGGIAGSAGRGGNSGYSSAGPPVKAPPTGECCSSLKASSSTAGPSPAGPSSKVLPSPSVGSSAGSPGPGNLCLPITMPAASRSTQLLGARGLGAESSHRAQSSMWKHIQALAPSPRRALNSRRRRCRIGSV